jgi:putative polyhydroxyalkanoate system protein
MRAEGAHMATIEIRRTHTLGLETAKKRAETLAEQMKEQLGLRWKWAGDDITFDAPSGAAKGATGKVICTATEVRVEIDLPFLLRAVKGTIEGKINAKLDANLR